jgi:hypothetical protein
VAKGRLGLRVCDRCGAEDETVKVRRFVFGDPQMRQIDLCAEHWEQVRAAVAPFLVGAIISDANQRWLDRRRDEFYSS